MTLAHLHIPMKPEDLARKIEEIAAKVPCDVMGLAQILASPTNKATIVDALMGVGQLAAANKVNAELVLAIGIAHEALKDSNALIVEAQAIIASYLEPKGKDAKVALFDLIGLFDGPRQRAVQEATRAALDLCQGKKGV